MSLLRRIQLWHFSLLNQFKLQARVASVGVQPHVIQQPTGAMAIAVLLVLANSQEPLRLYSRALPHYTNRLGTHPGWVPSLGGCR